MLFKNNFNEYNIVFKENKRIHNSFNIEQVLHSVFFKIINWVFKVIVIIH